MDDGASQTEPRCRQDHADLNQRTAESVMGWKLIEHRYMMPNGVGSFFLLTNRHEYDWKPATDATDAWAVGHRLCSDRKLWVSVQWCPLADAGMEHECAVCTFYRVGTSEEVATATARTREEAICRAALAALTPTRKAKP
jgi:hypothetical protein